MRQKPIKRSSLILVALCMGSLLMLPLQVIIDISLSANRGLTQEISNPAPEKDLKQLAKSITVKILATNSRGSGIIIKKEGQIYTVITNRHVIEAGAPYRIETPDRAIHNASLLTDVNVALKDNDLALLQFSATGNYPIASLGDTSTLKEGEEVFAAGYPFETEEEKTEEFVFNPGRITYILPQALKGGYQIGYTNEIEKGMSGGPIFNREGKIIGLNGTHRPVWGDNRIYVYQDGSEPSDDLRDRMRRSNWGIPMETLVKLIPKLIPSDLSTKLATNTPSTQTSSKISQEVDNIAKEITVKITYPTSNGSGVIIAKEGDNYSVLTAGHVVKKDKDETQLKTELKLITPDGKEYTINPSTIKTWEGLDLALLQFTSPQTYQVATLANYDLGIENRVVFVSGWAASPSGKSPSERSFSAGFLLGVGMNQAKNARSLSSGYELVYTNLTHGGISGGPILDAKGHLIGIHAGAEAEATPMLEGGGGARVLELGYSLGVPLRTFLAKVKQEAIKLNGKQDNSPTPRLSAPQQDDIVKSSLNWEKPPKGAGEVEWLNYGNRLLRALKYEDAIAAFDEAIKIKANFYQAWYAKGLALKSKKQYKQAVAAFKKAVDSKAKTDNPDFDEAWRQLGDCYFYLRQYTDARKALEKAIALKPDDFISYVWLGTVLREAGSYRHAIEYYDRAIKIKPRPLLYVLRGMTRRTIEDGQKALDDVNQAIRLQPDLATAYHLRGWVYSDLENYTAAIADLNEALRLQPDSGEIYAAFGSIYAKMNFPPGFKEKYDKALSLEPDNGDRYAERGWAYSDSFGNYEQAIKDYDQAITLLPESAYLYLIFKARARSGKEDYQGAIADLTESIRLMPDYTLSYMNRAIAEAQRGNKQAFLADFEQALKLEPDNAWIYSNRGYRRFQMGDTQGGIEDYKKAMDLAPELTYLFYNSRGNARSDKDYKGAIEDYTEAIRLKPDDPVFYTNRARVRENQKDYNGAIEDYTQAIKLNPNYASAYRLRGDYRYSREEYDSAIKDYTEVLRLNDKNAFYYKKRGNARAFNGDNKGALADFNAAIDLHYPNEVKVYGERGVARHRIGDYQGAIEDFTTVIDLIQKQEKQGKQDKDNFAENAYNQRGNSHYSLKDYDAGIKDYTAAIRLNPKNAIYYQNRGKARADKGDNKGAIDDYTQAIKLNPNDANTYNVRGNYRFSLKDSDGAIKDYTEAIRLNPKDAIYYQNRGNARGFKGDNKGAIEDYTAAIDLKHPDEAQMYGNRGVVRHRIGDYQGAIADYTRVIELKKPDLAETAYSFRGNSRSSLKDYDGAIKDYTEAIRLNPKNAIYYQNRGKSRADKGDYQGAIDDSSKAIELDSNNAFSYYVRGFARSQKKDNVGAREDLQKAAQLYQQQGKMEEYQKVLSNLKKLE
jgi:tetratricopeptide (TPR) repeat protein/S1-C subfamily serine protease